MRDHSWITDVMLWCNVFLTSLPHQNEIKAVLDVGFPPDCVIYAQPCKQISHLQYAAHIGVRMMTFDSELELYKVKAHLPTTR